MKFKTAFIIGMTWIMAACHTTSDSSSGADPLRSTATQGTGDSGGGNAYMGRPLESYIVKPKSLDSYKTQLADKAAALGADRAEFARLLDSVLVGKTWYFVPGPLKQLPATKIGSVVATDQVALQSFESVWVDKDLFNAMNEEDQARLLLHESLMGLKLLRFESLSQQCQAIADSFLKSDCKQMDSKTKGAPSDLTTTDYEDIRRAVVDLMSVSAPIAGEDVEDIFSRYNFDFDLRHFFAKDKLNTESDELLVQRLDNAYFSGAWPRTIHTKNQDGQVTEIGYCSFKRFKLTSEGLQMDFMPQLLNQMSSQIRANLSFENTELTIYDDGVRVVGLHSADEMHLQVKFVFKNQRLQLILVSGNDFSYPCSVK